MDEPNKLTRQAAGSYRTADQRFEVRGEANRWFLVDTEQADELGQELVRGPFATLDQVREAIPDARRAENKPLPVPKASRTAGKRKPKPTPPPPSWIDKLPAAEASRVRALISALEREGIDKPEQLVRRDREGLAPVVARRLIQRRLDALIADLPEHDRDAAREVAERVVELLTVEGTERRRGLPGWLLVELGPEREPPNRRITLPE